MLNFREGLRATLLYLAIAALVHGITEDRTWMVVLAAVGIGVHGAWNPRLNETRRRLITLEKKVNRHA